MQEKQIKDEHEEDIVKLKPILGIKPGVYLTVIYSVILLAILFYLLVLPGIQNPGSVLIVKTEPEGAAIRIDGVYMGTTGINTGEKIFAAKGERLIEAVLPGFETQSTVEKIPGRVFASRFFPRRYKLEFKLETTDPKAAFAQAAADYAAWTFGGEPTATWQIPLSLSEGAYRVGNVIEENAAREILTAASNFAVTRAALRDLVRAKMLIDNSGLSPSAASIFGSVNDILVFLSENPESTEWLADIFPPESAAIVRASDWYKNTSSPAASLQTTTATMRFNFADTQFLSIADNVFIAEIPVASGTINISSLLDLTELFPQRNEITCVSWFDAKEYCIQLTTQLPVSLSNMEVRLPTEEEWELAVSLGIIQSNDLWEWCADPFAPLRFKSNSAAIEQVGSPERTIRRMSATDSRASLPPDFASPYVTFRLVIAEKTNVYE